MSKDATEYCPLPKRRCLCGNAAVRKKSSGYVCARCEELEKLANMREAKKKRSGVKVSYGSGGMMGLDRDKDLTQSPICGASLAALNLGPTATG